MVYYVQVVIPHWVPPFGGLVEDAAARMEGLGLYQYSQ